MALSSRGQPLRVEGLDSVSTSPGRKENLRTAGLRPSASEKLPVLHRLGGKEGRVDTRLRSFSEMSLVDKGMRVLWLEVIIHWVIVDIA